MLYSSRSYEEIIYREELELDLRDKSGVLTVSTTFYETESTVAFPCMRISRESQRDSSVRRTGGH
jgi:hypothetical protein